MLNKIFFLFKFESLCLKSVIFFSFQSKNQYETIITGFAFLVAFCVLTNIAYRIDASSIEGLFFYLCCKIPSQEKTQAMKIN